MNKGGAATIFHNGWAYSNVRISSKINLDAHLKLDSDIGMKRKPVWLVEPHRNYKRGLTSENFLNTSGLRKYSVFGKILQYKRQRQTRIGNATRCDDEDCVAS